MTQLADVERYRENWQDEVDSAAEYHAMASSEPDPKIAKVYSNLAKMEEAHIGFWEERLRSAGEKVGERRPSWRSRVVIEIPPVRHDPACSGDRGNAGIIEHKATIDELEILWARVGLNVRRLLCQTRANIRGRHGGAHQRQ